MDNYQPVFTHMPDDAFSQWRLIRLFLECWHKISIPTTDCAEEIQRCERIIERNLPISFQEYIILSCQLTEIAITYPNGTKSDGFTHCLRDYYEVKNLEQHSAVSLMIQGEGDFYWAVQHHHLHLENPPVEGYLLDYDSPDNSVFENIGRMNDTITSFVLGHAGGYLFKQNTGGLQTKIEKTEALMTALRQDFETHSTMGNIEIFERENMVALLQPDIFASNASEVVLLFAPWKPHHENQLPKVWSDLVKKAWRV